MARIRASLSGSGGGGAVVLVDWYSESLSPQPSGQTYPQDGVPLVCPISGTLTIEIADANANNTGNPQVKKNGTGVSPVSTKSGGYLYFNRYQFSVAVGDEIIFTKGNGSQWYILAVIEP